MRVFAICLAACGGAPAAPAITRSSPGVGADSTGLPAAYASLFHDAETAFALAQTEVPAPSDGHPSVAHCRISGSHRAATAWVSQLQCYGDEAGILADGFTATFVGTPSGLWRNHSGLDEPDGPPLMGVPVSAGIMVRDDRRTTAIVAHHGDWCIVDTWGEDARPGHAMATLCFRPGRGIVGGAAADPRPPPDGFTLRFGDAP